MVCLLLNANYQNTQLRRERTVDIEEAQFPFSLSTANTCAIIGGTNYKTLLNEGYFFVRISATEQSNKH